MGTHIMSGNRDNVPNMFFEINKQKNECFKVMKKVKNDGECKV